MSFGMNIVEYSQIFFYAINIFIEQFLLTICMLDDGGEFITL